MASRQYGTYEVLRNDIGSDEPRPPAPKDGVVGDKVGEQAVE